MFYLLERSDGRKIIFNKKFCDRVFIEAGTADQAINRANEIGCCGNGVHAAEIDLAKYELEGYRVSVCDNMYKSTEQEWNNKYGEYEVVENPSLQVVFAFPEYSGRIKFRDIEEYVRFLIEEFDWDTPTDIYYSDETIKRIWRRN